MNAKNLLVLASFALGLCLGLVIISSRPRGSALSEPAEGVVTGKDLDRVFRALAEVQGALETLQLTSSVQGDRRVYSSDGPVPVTGSEVNGDHASVGTPGLEEQVDRLRAQIDAMTAVLEASQRALSNSQMAVAFPSQELLQRWPSEQKWDKLQEVIDACEGGPTTHGALVERLRWLPQGEVLRIYGRPSEIHKSGDWAYTRTGTYVEGSSTVQFTFIYDYVMGVKAY